MTVADLLAGVRWRTPPGVLITKGNTVMPSNCDATDAAYFLCGLEAGVLTDKDVKDWAYAEIGKLEHPPVEIIEIAMSGGRQALFDALKAVRGEPDIQQAGRWLLGLLKQELLQSTSSLRAITRRAMQVARCTNQPEDVYYQFDGIDDEIFLAENNTYGNLELCRSHLEAALAPYNEVRA